MSPNKRIFLNIVATYGRSLYALACGLFTSRWVLMALGQEDFGLYGVIGGLVMFIGFINSLLGTAVSRFYAVGVGAAYVADDPEAAVESCRQWFSSAVLVHTVVPFVLIVLGWPLCEYAIREGWIVVRPARLAACLWTFRFSCIACFVSMVTIPFSAMYTAKQYIAELTIYSFITTTCNMAFFYYMVSHPGVWLAKYAAWMAVAAVIPAVIIAIRAHLIFPECRLPKANCLNWLRIREIAVFAGWQAFGSLGAIFRSQGIAILLNRRPSFGSMRNSSMSVAYQLAAQTETLSGSMVGAFQPAIANAWGARNYEKARSLAFQTCKFGTLLSMIFVIPLALELPTILQIWLKDPPIYAAGLCWSVMAMHLIDRTSIGHMLTVNATGKIATYQAFLGGALILTLPLAWVFLKICLGIYSVGWAMIMTIVLCAWGRVWFARTIVGLSARIWFSKILIPLALLLVLALAAGLIPRLILSASFLRVIITTFVTEVALLPLAWFLLLDITERQYVSGRLVELKARFVK